MTSTDIHTPVNVAHIRKAIQARLRTERAEERGFMSDRHRSLVTAQQEAEDHLTDIEFEVYESAIRGGGTIAALDGVLVSLELTR